MAPQNKGARRTGRALAFLEETGHTFQARVATTWAPIGHPPVLPRVSQRRAVSTIAALVAPLDGPPRLYARHFLGSIHGQEGIVALRSFRRRIGRPLVILWDHLNAHQAMPVQDFVAAHPADYQIAWLPSYAPDLNPEEFCNGAVKGALVNAQPGSVEELRRDARRGFLRLGRRTADLTGDVDIGIRAHCSPIPGIAAGQVPKAVQQFEGAALLGAEEEISATVDRHDVERAVERAGFLARLGRTVLPVVAGHRLDQEAEPLIADHGVLAVLDGRTSR